MVGADQTQYSQSFRGTKFAELVEDPSTSPGSIWWPLDCNLRRHRPLTPCQTLPTRTSGTLTSDKRVEKKISARKKR
jgi:hypothetical protein